MAYKGRCLRNAGNNVRSEKQGRDSIYGPALLALFPGIADPGILSLYSPHFAQIIEQLVDE